MDRREKLTELTDRWRARHDAGRTEERRPAGSEREALATSAFPFRTMTPAAYVAEHGPEMIGFTYDETRYADPELDAWLVDVGRLLRARR